jgi:hypothetical protein
MLVHAPPFTQHGQAGLGQRDVTILIPFAMPDVQHHSATVDILDLQVHAFPQAQATGIDCAQADPVVLAVETT